MNWSWFSNGSFLQCRGICEYVALLHSPPPHPSLYMCYTVWTTENWLKTIEQTSLGASSSGPSSSCWPANQTLWRLTRSRKGQPQQSQVTAAVSENSIKDPEIPGTDWTMGNDAEGEVKPVTTPQLWQIQVQLKSLSRREQFRLRQWVVVVSLCMCILTHTSDRLLMPQSGRYNNNDHHIKQHK